MKESYLNDISENIKKTGFDLEYKITKKLNNLDWTTINNRYYVDDIDSTPREIDIIAYKSDEIDKVRYYTVLIISCKKSEANSWGFLTKELYQKDPNFNHYPISDWTNDDHLKFMLKKEKPEDSIVEQLDKNITLKAIYGLEKQVFAFQEICKKNATAKNDKNIFGSIISLIKALGYERKSLDHRVKVKSYYNFNLLSVADTEFIDIHFNDDYISSSQIASINYLNRFIVWNESDFYRINFISYDSFDEIITHYADLHDWNQNHYSILKKRFFDELLKDQEKLDFQFKRNLHLLIKSIGYDFNDKTGKELQAKDFNTITFDDGEKMTIRMDLSFDFEFIDILNENKRIQSSTRFWLKWSFNFIGKFEYDFELPF